jgi:DNA polymerase III subunit beta
MKLQILQENLIKALNRTGKIISNKTQLPILQNVLLTTENGFLRLTTTNMEISMSTTVGAKIEKEGKACVSSKMLIELVSSLPQETVFLEEKDGQLIITTSRTHASLAGLSAEEFPPVNLSTGKDLLEIEKKEAIEAFGAVLYAAATDEGRPVLTGIKIKTEEEKLIFVATDGYRLSVKSVDWKIKKELDLLVPAKALMEAHRLISEEKDGQLLKLDKNADGQLCLTVGETSIIARLIDGEYPPYGKIIPTTHTSRAEFDKNEFLQAVKSASIFARDNANIVKIHLDKNGITVSANAPAVGQNTIDIEAKIVGEPADIAFNSRFLIDFLNNCNCEELAFEMTGSLNSGLFRPLGDESFLHIIMPVRVQS